MSKSGAFSEDILSDAWEMYLIATGKSSDDAQLEMARILNDYQDSATYWKGAYERMAARNVELERQLEELRK